MTYKLRINQSAHLDPETRMIYVKGECPCGWELTDEFPENQIKERGAFLADKDFQDKCIEHERTHTNAPPDLI